MKKQDAALYKQYSNFVKKKTSANRHTHQDPCNEKTLPNVNISWGWYSEWFYPITFHYSKISNEHFISNYFFKFPRS